MRISLFLIADFTGGALCYFLAYVRSALGLGDFACSTLHTAQMSVLMFFCGPCLPRAFQFVCGPERGRKQTFWKASGRLTFVWLRLAAVGLVGYSTYSSVCWRTKTFRNNCAFRLDFLH